MWKKKDNAKSIEDVIERNTGLTISELSKVKEYDIPNIPEVANTIRQHIKKGSFITVINDYDVDGAASGAIIDLLLTHLKARFKVRPPKRFSEGYGLSEKIIDEINDGLVITVDNGIVAFNAIKKAKEKGIDVIVIDHHLPAETGEIPIADCIIDPHLYGNMTFNDYCGAALAYRLLKYMVKDEALVKKANALAAIATVADVMPLIYENRVIVKNGLEIMNQRKHLTMGLLTLLNVSEIERVTSTSIGFKIGPMLNAPGRLLDDGSFLSYQILAFEGNMVIASDMAKKLVELNKERQQLVKKTLPKAEAYADKFELQNNSCIVIYLANICEGIIGILAGRIAEEYKRPCIFFTNKHDDKDVLKASARTYGDIHLKNLLDTHKEYLLGYGGHKGAAGLSLKRINHKSFFNSISNYLPLSVYSNDIEYDLEIKSYEIPKYLELLEKYEPYGEHNPKPVFKITDFINTPTSVGFERYMGDDGQHIKLFGKEASATAFDMSNRFRSPISRKYNFVGTLSYNIFQGHTENSIEVIDFKNITNDTKIETNFATKLKSLAANRYEEEHI